jgi:ElaB/YqjD/DUF883 family membrane-anchored ribosome-binding protein
MHHNGKDDINRAMEKAQELFREGWRHLDRATEEARQHGQEALEQARVRGRAVWEEARAVGTRHWRDMRDRGEDFLEDSERLVRKNPGQAVGFSLVAGMIIGALLFGRRRD